MKIKTISIFFLLTCFCFSIYTQSIEWTVKASLPKPMRGAAISCNEKIYFFEASHNNSGVYEYSPLRDNWIKVSDMISPGWNINLAELDGIIYVIGGDPFLNRIESYDPIKNEWKKLTSMPTGRQHSNCSVVDEKIYVMGGLLNWTSETDKNEVYTPLTDSWDSYAPLPERNGNPILASIDDEIFALCGNQLWMYNTKSDNWYRKQDCPEWVSVMFGSAVIGKYFIIPGGQNVNEKALSSVYIYDSVSDVWTQSTELPNPIQLGGITTLNEKIYIIGGCDSDFRAYNTVFEGIVGD